MKEAILVLLIFVVNLTTTVLSGSSDGWLYIQNYVDDSDCTTASKQTQAIRTGVCHQDKTFFSILFPHYVYRNKNAGEMHTLNEDAFSYQFIMSDTYQVFKPPLPGNRGSGSDGSGRSYNSTENDDINFIPSSPGNDTYTNDGNSTSPIDGGLIINPLKSKNSNTMSSQSFEFVITKSLGDFLIYYGNAQCQGDVADKVPLNYFVPTAEHILTTLSSTDDWVANGCKIRNSTNPIENGIGAVSLKFLDGLSYFEFKTFQYTNDYVLEEEVYAQGNWTDCDYYSIIRNTVTAADSCVSYDGLTSTYYQCVSKDAEVSEVITFYNDSSSCRQSQFFYGGLSVPTISTCPVTSIPGITLKSISSSSSRSLPNDEDLLRATCTYVNRQIGGYPSLSPVIVPTLAPTTRTTAEIDLVISFTLSPLTGNDETLIKPGSKSSISLRMDFATLVCEQLELSDVSACVCPEVGCLSFSTGPSSGGGDGEGNGGITILPVVTNSTDSSDGSDSDGGIISITPLSNTLSLSRMMSALYDAIHTTTTHSLLRRAIPLASGLLASPSDPKITPNTVPTLVVNVNVTVNTIDFYNNALTDSSDAEVPYPFAISQAEANVAVNVTLSTLQSRLQYLSTSLRWQSLAYSLRWKYMYWFSDNSLSLQDTRMKVVNVDIPQSSTPSFGKQSSPTFTPTLMPTTLEDAQESEDDTAFTRTEIIGLAISLSGILALPIAVLMMFRVREKVADYPIQSDGDGQRDIQLQHREENEQWNGRTVINGHVVM